MAAPIFDVGSRDVGDLQQIAAPMPGAAALIMRSEFDTGSGLKMPPSVPTKALCSSPSRPMSPMSAWMPAGVLKLTQSSHSASERMARMEAASSRVT